MDRKDDKVYCANGEQAKVLAAFARYKCGACNTVNEVTNVTILEWLGFQYAQFLDSIKAFISADQFTALAASNEIELQAGKFSQADIEKCELLIAEISELLTEVNGRIDVRKFRNIVL